MPCHRFQTVYGAALTCSGCKRPQQFCSFYSAAANLSRHPYQHLAPVGPESTQQVRRLCVLIAIEDMEPLAPDKGCHLADRGLPGACVPYQESRLLVCEAAIQQSIPGSAWWHGESGHKSQCNHFPAPTHAMLLACGSSAGLPATGLQPIPSHPPPSPGSHILCMGRVQTRPRSIF